MPAVGIPSDLVKPGLSDDVKQADLNESNRPMDK